MIQLQSINLNIHGQQIFKNLNINIKKHQKILLKMPSGAGKSTFLKTIMGFIPIDSGDVIINGKTLNSENISVLRQDFAYIGQNIIFTGDTVNQYIEFIFSFKNNKNIILDLKKLNFYLEKFKLNQNILKKHPKLLSGGEKQRIAIIIVLLLDRSILLLDEVTSGLDHELKIILIETIKDLDKTIIVSSHDNQWLDYNNFQIMGW